MLKKTLRWLRNKATRDYTPSYVRSGGYVPEYQKYSGGAELFYRFIHTELIPYLKQTYRVNNSYTFVGHSYGGLFGAYLLVHHPEIFNHYIIVSPSLWYDNHLVLKSAKKMQNFNLHQNTSAFFIIGDQENKGDYRIERSAKLIYKYEAINKMPAKLKIEINTTEHFQVLPLKTVPFTLESDWFNGAANIITYELDELMATKLRALYQRRKGRDLFDLWFVSQHDLINLDRTFEIFKKYCMNDDSQFSRDEFLKILELKRNHPAFQSDMHALLPAGLHWNFEDAYQFVVDKVISKLS